MRTVLTSIICLIALISCAQTTTTIKGMADPKDKPGPHEAVATFSEGCFWHAEIVFQSLVGVRDAVSGYAGGTTTDPNYETVSSGTTGHAETVQVYYDPTKISYATLVNAFFSSQDPTQVNGQGYDMGTEYRSIAFYRNASEKQIIETAINKINASKKYADKVATQVVAFTKFYPAEEYHQEYVYNHLDEPYVSHVCIPELMNFKKEFKGNFK
jgi:peptide-methionine (S)-S-oxide reductase